MISPCSQVIRRLRKLVQRIDGLRGLAGDEKGDGKRSGGRTGVTGAQIADTP